MNEEKKYIHSDFLLENEVAKELFHEYSEALPIIDYHCHLSPQEIFEDKSYDNITQAWLYGDHYKWRIMRACGVPENAITGAAADKEKFMRYAESLESAIGNPLHHWSHMELKKYFGYYGVLNGKTAEVVWNHTKKYIEENGLSARRIIEASNVEVICTTDDPIDDLNWHKKIDEESVLKTKVLPAWRPDRILNLEREGFPRYIERLGEVSGLKIEGMADLKSALTVRMDYFASVGCKVSDHGIEDIPFVEEKDEVLDKILRNALKGEPVSLRESEAYKTALLIYMAKEYRKRGWVMQLHYGCNRNINKKMFDLLGPDTGFDGIGGKAKPENLAGLLNRVECEVGLPKTIVYSLNPEDNAVIDTIIGGFSEDGVRGKMQHGSAWWFNDHKSGMEEQMSSLATKGVLGNFVGMLTDSRSFLSFARHEYFRRILCNMIGEMVGRGLYPMDMDSLGRIVKNISYENAKAYFDFG